MVHSSRNKSLQDALASLLTACVCFNLPGQCELNLKCSRSFYILQPETKVSLPLWVPISGLSLSVWAHIYLLVTIRSRSIYLCLFPSSHLDPYSLAFHLFVLTSPLLAFFFFLVLFSCPESLCTAPFFCVSVWVALLLCLCRTVCRLLAVPRRHGTWLQHPGSSILTINNWVSCCSV